MNFKINYLAQDVFKANMGLDNDPFKLIINNTTKCNLKCKTCHIWDKKSQDLSLNSLKDFLKVNNNFSWIDVTGGEIFLHDDISKIFNLIISKCNRLEILHFPTNGYLTKEIMKHVKQIKKKFKNKLIVTVSIDGPKELHNLLRGSKNAWDNATKTYSELKKINKETYIGYTISSHNIGKLYETISELNKIEGFSINNLHINLAQESESYYNNKTILPNKNQIIKEIDYVIKNKKLSLFNFIEIKYLRLLRKYVKTNNYPLESCGAGKYTSTLNYDGKVKKCLFLDKKNEVNNCKKCFTACEAAPTMIANLIRV